MGKKKFKPGDPLSKLADADFLNWLVDQAVSKVQNRVGNPLNQFAGAGKMIHAEGFERPLWRFCELVEDLEPFESATARIRRTLSSAYDTTDLEFTVRDYTGNGACINTYGMAFLDLESAKEIYVFVPLELGKGASIMNYNAGVVQILAHDGSTCLKWLDVTNCSSSGSSSGS